MNLLRLIPLAGVLWLLFVGARPATITYTTIDDATSRCRFSFPTGYRLDSDGDAAVYSLESEGIAFEVNRFYTGNTFGVNSPSLPIRKTNASTTIDYEDVFVEGLRLTTEGQILSQTNVTVNNRQGRDMELMFYTEDGVQRRMTVRFFWAGNSMIAFSTTWAVSSDGTTKNDAKQTLFNSVQFY